VDSNELIRNLKIIVIIAVIIGVVGAVLYLIYGFAIIWQAMAAAIITGFLSILIIIFVVVSIYLWTKNLLLKRDLRKNQMELRHCRAELNKIKNSIEKNH
jgi:CHASE3 domain sensor protein